MKNIKILFFTLIIFTFHSLNILANSDYTAKDISINAKENEVTFTLSQQSFPNEISLNKESTKMYDLEYVFGISFSDGEKTYEVSSIHYKLNDKPEKGKISDLQSALWLHSNQGDKMILELEPPIQKDSTLTWKFEFPESEKFDLSKISFVGAIYTQDKVIYKNYKLSDKEPELIGNYNLFDNIKSYETIKKSSGSSGKTQINNSKTVIKKIDSNKVNGKAIKTKVLLNGEEKEISGYNISGNTYFKLRDVANLLSNTDKKFDLTYDAERKAIKIKTGEEYSDNSEINLNISDKKDLVDSNIKLIIDNNDVSFNIYNIDGNNYFKLRDIAKAFNFKVSYDNDKNLISLNTEKTYE